MCILQYITFIVYIVPYITIYLSIFIMYNIIYIDQKLNNKQPKTAVLFNRCFTASFSNT